MEVILREDVDKLGRRGDVVKVAEGYGRNFLLPRGLAMAVTDGQQGHDRAEQKAHEARVAKEKAESRGAGRAHRRPALRGPAQGGGERRALRLRHLGDVAEFLKAKGIEIDKRKVQLEEPIKKLGEHEVKIKLHPEVTATLKLLVSKEG